ncbi:PhzF family phenazine biosynthesis protein [Paenibacillus beijingensis]|uniref:Oxidoreductase n=1 Tax=Paenibacillus beijingensis TaxID=1126833 RepID=A0A0D5NEJ1_9BACL|nr:PhzF family phenazine biosynthesis protein [Paenibacillus beijingensis]AJY73338.1 hypothetical protein VN24_00215 [Paenibacillus beijingensis]
MKVPIYLVDAFTKHKFKGNPAAVCLLEEPVESSRMQAVAAEMNQSETAFIVPPDSGNGLTLRWFTPAQEVELCGHATLAAAHILWETGRLRGSEPATFQTLSGTLHAELGEDGTITLDFPSEPVRETSSPEELIQGLGLIPRYTGRNRMDYLIEVDSARTVRGLRPDWSMLSGLDGRGVIVTSRSDDAAYDFVSRAFYPNLGINEDPVTGSAHCALAPYWGKRLRKSRMHGYQESQRGGEVLVELQGDRVLLGGRAVTVLCGELDG